MRLYKDGMKCEFPKCPEKAVWWHGHGKERRFFCGKHLPSGSVYYPPKDNAARAAGIGGGDE